MDWKQTYNSKLVSVEEAAAKIESGDRIWMGPCSGAPIQITEALARSCKRTQGCPYLNRSGITSLQNPQVA